MSITKQQQYNKEYHQKNKQKRLEQVTKWKKENPEKAKQHVNNYRESHPIYYVLKRAKDRATKLNLEFNLTEEDIVIPNLCPYLHFPLSFTLGKGHQDSNISLDRIDNSKGYIKGNIEIISHLANRMKSNSTKNQLELFAIEVLKRANKCRCKVA